MAWVVLVISGLLEAVWATAMSASSGFQKKVPTALFAAGLPASLIGLAYAMTSIPTGTAYAVWVGIGTILTSIYTLVRRTERLSPARCALLLILIGSIIGLKVVA